mgnify:CR=1 FL=1
MATEKKAVKKQEEKTKETIVIGDGLYPKLIPSVVRQVLNRKVPKQFLYTRPGRGGIELTYISVGYVVSALNEAFGEFWNFVVALI